MLELIDKGSCSDTHPTPLLFVHGAWHSAWCWDEHFLDFFADNGYRALALSLRGHGGSPTAKPIHTISIADYVEDVVTVAEGLPTPPVVIGHSMGGFVVQKYLETHQAPAGVLLASIPPKGIGPFLMRWTKRQPWPMTCEQTPQPRPAARQSLRRIGSQYRGGSRCELAVPETRQNARHEAEHRRHPLDVRGRREEQDRRRAVQRQGCTYDNSYSEENSGLVITRSSRRAGCRADSKPERNGIGPQSV
jgi:pimeloyl-ACP methyl ester carboxylesterase